MDDRGQMLLLSALAVCICLIMLTVCLTSIEAVEAPEEPAIENGVPDNVAWALQNGMRQTAGKVGSSQWEQRHSLTSDFKNVTDRLIDDASRIMQKRGVAFSFAYNDSLAREYLGGNELDEGGHIDGVLIKKEGTIARVGGCAFDLVLTDGSTQYYISKVIAWV